MELEVWAGIPGREGQQDGEVSEASLSYPERLAEDNLGNLYIVERNRAHLRRLSPAARIDTIVPRASGSATNMGAIWSIAVAPDDTIYVYSNSRLWRGVASEGCNEVPMEMGPEVAIIDFVLARDQSIIGTSSEGRGLLGVSWSGRVEELGCGDVSPSRIAASSEGDFYMTADRCVLKKASGSSNPKHFAPTNQRTDGRGPETWFTDSGGGIDIDGDGRIYVADGFGYVFSVANDGKVSILADLDEGTQDVLVSRNGHLLVADYFNHAVLRSTEVVTPKGQRAALDWTTQQQPDPR